MATINIIWTAPGGFGVNSDAIWSAFIFDQGFASSTTYEGFNAPAKFVSFQGDFSYSGWGSFQPKGDVWRWPSSGTITSVRYDYIGLEITGLSVSTTTYQQTHWNGGWMTSDLERSWGGSPASALLFAGDDVFLGGPNSDTMSGWAGDDSLYGGQGDDLIFEAGGGLGHDYIRGEEGNDRLYGGAGFDDINGNQGNDTARGGDGDDWVVGGKDNDQVYGDAGADIVYGNLGNDTVSGGDGNDWVRGGQGDDSVSGDAGNDVVWGDRGDDTVSGGAGADTFRFFSGGGVDRVTDFSYAEGDRVVIEGGAAWTLSQSGSDTVVALSGGADTLVLVGVTLSNLPDGWIAAG